MVDIPTLLQVFGSPVYNRCSARPWQKRTIKIYAELSKHFMWISRFHQKKWGNTQHQESQIKHNMFFPS